jgi:hypothetical protein
VNGLRRETSADLYDDLAVRLRARDMEVEVIHGAKIPISRLGDYDLLISNTRVPAEVRATIAAYGSSPMSRPTSLRLLKDFGLPTMEWTLAKTRREVRALFDHWGTERVLLKSSFTYGGKGVRVFTMSAVWRLLYWRPDLDVFCREVNSNDGDVYKAELFNGRLIISWKSVAPPIHTLFRRGMYRGLRGAYGERTLWELPSSLAAKLEAFSRMLTAKGLGHVSVDLMRRADDEFVAIELNPGTVATWWTRQFPHFRERYSDALYELAIQQRLALHDSQR